MRKRYRGMLAGLALAALVGAACGGDDGSEAEPLDPDAVIAAVEENVDATSFCTPDQLALEPGDAVTCPAAAQLEDGPVEGDLVLTREGEEEELSYELSMSGPGGNKAGAGSFAVESEDASSSADAGEVPSGGGSPLEQALAERLDGAEVSCERAKPPVKGETVSCTAAGEDEEGVAYEGELTVRRSTEAEAVGSQYTYEATLEKEDGGTRYSGGVFSLD